MGTTSAGSRRETLRIMVASVRPAAPPGHMRSVMLRQGRLVNSFLALKGTQKRRETTLVDGARLSRLGLLGLRARAGLAVPSRPFEAGYTRGTLLRMARDI